MSRAKNIMSMVEVFKTNVYKADVANMLIDNIQKKFIHYKANFDLKDCDKILRIKCINGSVEAGLIIGFLNGFGFEAEVLPDDVCPA